MKKRKGRKPATSFKAALKAAGFDSYEKYLESRHWKAFRKRMYSKLPICSGCLNPQARIILHHVEYGRLGWEQEGDVIPLCDPCHSLIHAQLDSRFPGTSVFAKARKTALIFAEVFPAGSTQIRQKQSAKLSLTEKRARQWARRLEIERAKKTSFRRPPPTKKELKYIERAKRKQAAKARRAELETEKRLTATSRITDAITLGLVPEGTKRLTEDQYDQARRYRNRVGRFFGKAKLSVGLSDMVTARKAKVRSCFILSPI